MTDKTSLSYRDAGVDIDAGNELVKRIGPVVKKTFRPGVLTGLGGFGGLFELPVDRFREPVLVSGTDGVGTKLKVAMMMNRHDTIGIDLVAMCVNDIIVAGAEPLFFLDYFATGKLNIEAATDIIGGIAEGCLQAGAALIGGETAEMPGMYEGDDYDLAGFAVGIAEKSRLLSPGMVRPGDALLGLCVVRVKDLVPEERWRRRYEHINAFERLLADSDVAIVKFFLHISKEEQKERFEDPAQYEQLKDVYSVQRDRT